ncbi:hypothetical protein OWM54_15805 [Myxococcus sp. MISCRS1]|jgi:hypothetical protein|uniref:Uncharacterized protein n=1 Tax=Myxococcus fulvus TaxID=33 RepID=A0A511SUF2_MYXFU|nr:MULTISPECIES: hypothetical protein [Myxococcus]AKF84862.1 hypothetical protein MFUL124B02_05535 [Myxococcus fulvus 124B02]BDT31404.1 hypothetical protein MFMH1_10730 [Myxococcus sp. MH1]MBZ4397866.1 hypothetical protein [Myxococcus sp. AS-1-15]MBZ4407570.1 hypothetical protein [Myxococcus sp. XM-1-1-1]MCY0998603.1 hypothetical protein [Myxococcus sp. MISCRS1]
MTSGSKPVESSAADAHVKNNYVDCATTVGVQRARKPLPMPSSPALASAPQQP